MSSARYLAPLAGIVLGLLAAGCSDEGEPSPTIGASSGSLTKKKAAETGCTDNADCESQVCFKGNNQSFCTVSCTTETASQICVAPFTGSCNKQGYCKRD
jgi:hypothetical protein